MERGAEENYPAQMKFSLTVLPEAEQDIAEAYRWYEEGSAGLGWEFLRAMDVCLSSIERNPILHQAVDKLMRRRSSEDFPMQSTIPPRVMASPSSHVSMSGAIRSGSASALDDATVRSFAD